jgi:hypothetical protein
MSHSRMRSAFSWESGRTASNESKKLQNTHCKMQMRDPTSFWLSALAHLPSNPRAASKPLHHSIRIPQHARQNFTANSRCYNNHHRFSLSCSTWSRTLNSTTAPALDALVLCFERRPNPAQVMDVALGSPAQFPLDQIDDFASEISSLYGSIDMRPKIAVALCLRSKKVCLPRLRA